MMLIDFIKENASWQEILGRPPYCIKMKWLGDYCLLKYDQINSDFSLGIVKECRGVILYFDNGIPVPVCVPFYKFGNYGESYVKDIDWASAVVMEKIDGSLMKVWWHDGFWHLSTNGNIDAFDTYVDDTNTSFGDLFERCIDMPFKVWCEQLNKGWTYMFELTTAENKVVVNYNEDAIWFLGMRNNYTLNESDIIPQISNVKYPKIFQLTSLDGCIKAAAELGDNAEGFVVHDKNFDRIKVKNPAWLAASHLKGNDKLSDKKILKMVRSDMLDDYLAYFPNNKEKVEQFFEKVKKFSEAMESAYSSAEGKERKEIAKEYYGTAAMGYIFYAMDGKGTIDDYIEKLSARRLLEYLTFYD